MRKASAPALAGLIALCVIEPSLTGAQQSLPPAERAQQPTVQARPNFGDSIGGTAPGVFMQVPLSVLSPGAAPSRPTIKNPVQGDPQATERGMTYFINLNCIGCHADNGGGGMGPALSNTTFIYGGQPENIYLSIFQGRPNGMPAWGAVLPDSIIWDLVTYIGKLSSEPNPEWGRTFSKSPLSPKLEQVPAEQVTTTDPWSSTKSFSSGQKP
jgi:cytochrome c oxidase cbb3-type subunit III